MKKPTKKAGGYKTKKVLKSATKKSAKRLAMPIVEETAKVTLLRSGMEEAAAKYTGDYGTSATATSEWTFMQGVALLAVVAAGLTAGFFLFT